VISLQPLKRSIVMTERPVNRYLFYGVIVLLFFGLLWMVAQPYVGTRYNYGLGDIVQENIISRRDITYINVRETQKRIDEVKGRVPPIFELQESVREKQIDLFSGLIEAVRKGDDVTPPVGVNERNLALLANPESGTADILREMIGYFAENGLTTLSREELSGYQSTGIIIKKIKLSEITQEKVGAEEPIAADETEQRARSFLENRHPEISNQQRRVLLAVLPSFLQPNLFYDRETSMAFLAEEMEKVKPVYNTIKKGAVVVRSGEEINEENLPKLRAITQNTSRLNVKAILGIGTLILILLFIALLVLLEEPNSSSTLNFMVFGGFVLLSVFYAYLVSLISSLPDYLVFGVLMPTAGITMTAELLYKRRFSITLAILLPILFLLVSGNDPYTFIFTLGSGFVAIFAVGEAEKRSDLLSTIPLIVVSNGLILTAVGLLRELTPRQFAMLLIWGAGNGIVSVVLTLGITPFFEIIFNLPTNFRLLELSDLNTQIMKKMQIEAPGTYHHSINVANMAENAARAVKANPLLVRVAALYHDIGKIPNAEYFIENNQGTSKHSFIKPSLSNSILKAHLKMGIDMARRMKLPKDVIDIIAQHHGTSLMKYFYHQALKKKEEQSDINKHDYHYPGPKPQNREAAIVMLADAVEASSRVLKNPSSTRIEEFVNDQIDSKFREGQLNESTLTLRGLMKISIAFRRYLTGVFHSRIEYPEDRDVDKLTEERKG
jgi:putative nucleotidyltransferase with HDIG domain